jgi:hypothetical protein
MFSKPPNGLVRNSASSGTAPVVQRLHHQAGGSSAMSDATSQKLGVLAKLVILLAIVMIVAGVLWHGVTVATFYLHLTKLR